MKKLKVSLFFYKNKKIIIFITMIVIITIVIFGYSIVDINIAEINPTIFGVVGTLLGAAIGGFFSFMGSMWVNSRQQRAKQDIRRKEDIYSPLYDELVDIQNRILEENPFPDYIVFQKGQQTYNLHPQFVVWGCIKGDSRYLEVPTMLISQMERLECAVHKYMDIRDKASGEIQKIVEGVFMENKLGNLLFPHIGAAISSDILGNRKTDTYDDVMEMATRNKEDSENRENIDKQIFERCNENKDVLDARKCYENWLDVQRETIEMLSLLIRQVLVKYEG